MVAMKGGRVVVSGAPEEVVTEELLADVFELRAAILRELALGRPHVMPLGLSAHGPDD